MRFENFAPAERRVLLHALDNQIQWLVGRLSVPIEPGTWQSCHEVMRRQRSIELSVVRKLRSELSELVKTDLNS
ncbi:MAG: hypothetical protein NC131_12770 [Roseburia sp.]|nr:hypothetical protein [Roseburia sp.]